MPLTYPTTDDTPTLVAILPDWGGKIRQSTVYRTDITRSRRGLEQRAQRRRTPTLAIEYTVAQDGQDAQRRLEAILAETRGPIIAPWWPHGLRLQEAMPATNVATLAGLPIADDWDTSGWCYLWSPADGGEWRILASRTTQTLHLTDTGPHTEYPAGAWAFPARHCVRELDQTALAAQHHLATIDRLTLRTL